MTQNRDSNGKYIRSRKAHVLVFLGITTVVMFLVWFIPKLQVVNTYASASTAVKAPTRLEQTQTLINELQAQRENDPTFIAETNKEMDALKQSRVTQSRIDALTIVQTQIDDEIASLSTTTK